MYHVLLSGTFFFFSNLGGAIGLFMVIFNIQLLLMLSYLMHRTLEQKNRLQACQMPKSYPGVSLDLPDFSYEESQTAHRLSKLHVMFFFAT